MDLRSRTTATLALSLALLAGCNPPPPAAPENVAPIAGKVVVDVRSESEWAQGHLDGAAWIPLDRLGAEIGRVAPKKDTPLALYCASGVRSGQGVEQLKALGYTRVENLGGIDAARAALGR